MINDAQQAEAPLESAEKDTSEWVPGRPGAAPGRKRSLWLCRPSPGPIGLEPIRVHGSADRRQRLR